MSVSVHVPRLAVSLAEVRRHRTQIVVRVFGSVARGAADADSDLDLLIDVDPGHGYFAMAGFALEVEDLLGVFTQVRACRLRSTS